MQASEQEVRAWRPRVPGLVEALHARFVDHVYPMHTHDTWTLLILDSGGIKYDLDVHEHGSLGQTVTLLPPHVPHSGSSIRPEGFRKRVLYLDESYLSDALIGRNVDHPVFVDGVLRDRISRLHETLVTFGGRLKGRDRQLFDQRLMTDQPRTLQELGDDFGISRERTRQLEMRLMARLKVHLASSLGDAVHAHAA